MADIIITKGEFKCGCGFEFSLSESELDCDIECPKCGKVYQLVYYLVPEDESEDK